ncbi:MAG TPA: hypothetical protein VJZ26_16755, partial [Blastocatellia bacterium]|nr:hypothetical protein [Blastocatellia bacterium]
MKNTLKLTWLLVIASAGVSIAGAQTLFREFNADSRGRGVIRLDNQRDEDVTNATVTLRRGGDAEVRISGRTSWTFTGRWTGGNGNDVDLDITGFANSRAEARGRLTLTRGGGFDRLEISGRTRGQNFSVTFDTDRREGGWPGRGDNRSNDFVGTFRTSYSPRPGSPDAFKIVRVLKIREDGSAELISRYQNTPPSLSRSNLSLLGDLLREVEARKRVSHTGSWRAFGRRLEVTLSNLEGRDRTVSRMTFEFRNNDRTELLTTGWNRNDYGTLGFEFKRMDNDEDDDADQGGGQGQTPNRLAGSYSTRLQVPDSDGQIERTLQLSANGDARLTTEWIGGRTPRISSRAERELGRLIRGLENRMSVVHSGRWQYRNNQVVVDFDNLDRSRETGSMTFDVRGDRLDAVRV